MWLGVVLLVALAIFIVWDSRRLKRGSGEPISRKKMSAGYVPQGLVTWHFWMGMSMVAGLLAAEMWGHPSHPPFTGRWGWMKQIAFVAFGDRGEALLFVILGVIAGVAGLAGWRLEQLKRRKNRQPPG